MNIITGNKKMETKTPTPETHYLHPKCYTCARIFRGKPLDKPLPRHKPIDEYGNSIGDWCPNAGYLPGTYSVARTPPPNCSICLEPITDEAVFTKTGRPVMHEGGVTFMVAPGGRIEHQFHAACLQAKLAEGGE
jgi:hypothetical protein